MKPLHFNGRASLAALSRNEEDTLTLQAFRGDTTWAFSQRPRGLKIRSGAKILAVGVTFLAGADSCPIPPSRGCTWKNPWAEVEAVPAWLRTLVFEGPDDSPVRHQADSAALSMASSLPLLPAHPGATSSRAKRVHGELVTVLKVLQPLVHPFTVRVAVTVLLNSPPSALCACFTVQEANSFGFLHCVTHS